MRLALAIALVSCLGQGWCRARAQGPAPVENVSTFPPRTPAEERKALHPPEGFEVELVASEPEIHKPMNMAFDDRGRLWITDTVEYPFPAAEGKRPRDAVKVLEDFQADGRAGKITTFADGLNIPLGVLPLPSCRGALVYSIPSIDRFLDTDGDGRADRREVAYKSYGHKDTHGMTNSFTWGFDGWIYACHGFSNTSTVQGSDRAAVTMESGNSYRMKPDGSHLEYYTHGQVNPFGMAFDALGNLFSADCHSKPLYLLMRGAYYPSFGRPDDGLGFAPEMMTHDHGSTAIAGALVYAADHFPAPYHGRVFVGNVVTNRINADRLEWHGSSPRAIPLDDFLWSEDNWFRPVDLKLGPDGALYVADFYNRIIGHYEVPLTHPGRDRERGRIWRIVYRGPDRKGKAASPRADWTSATIGELVEDLGHPNLTVRFKAANQLVERHGIAAIEPVRAIMGPGGNTARRVTEPTPNPQPPSPMRRVHGLWVLSRLGALDDARLAAAASDPDRALRIHAMRVLGERPASAGPVGELARAGLRDPDSLVRRAAAEALSVHPEPANIRALLDLRQSTSADDPQLIYMTRLALREQLRPGAAWLFLAILNLSERDSRDIADIATGVPIPESADFLLQHLQRWPEPAETLVRYVHHIARHGAPEKEPKLIDFVRSQRGAGLGSQTALLKEIQKGTQERGAALSPTARSFALALALPALGSSRNEEVQAGIELASTFQLREAVPGLESLAKSTQAAEPRRVAAILALVAIDPKAAASPLGQILADPSAPLPIRERTARSLAEINQPESQAELLKVLPTAPESLQGAIASGLAARRAGADALLDAIAKGKASARLLQEQRVAQPLAGAGIPDLSTRLATLLRGLPAADQRLQEMLKRRRAGFGAAPSASDPAVGAQVFEKNCANCHQIAGKGAKIGPQLDGIGARGPDRLIEDLLDPSRNVDQAFRVTNLALRDGRVVSGLLLREEGAVLVLADAQGKEIRVPRDQVEDRTVSPLSPMPANLADQIAENDFYQLLAFLLTQHTPQRETPR